VARGARWLGRFAGGLESQRPRAGASPPRTLLGEKVVKGFYGGEFVVFDVENGVELGDVEDVVDLLSEVEELEFASGVADGGEAGDEFSDAGAVE